MCVLRNILYLHCLIISLVILEIQRDLRKCIGTFVEVKLKDWNSKLDLKLINYTYYIISFISGLFIFNRFKFLKNKFEIVKNIS